MKALEFFQDESAGQLLERSARCAGVPVSLQFVERNQEGNLIRGWGACKLCNFVNDLPEGRRACRQSRKTAASMALRQARAMPFLCHMGFACVSVPALEGEGFVLTFGPYSPQKESRSLSHDVLAGLNELTGETWDELPEDLDDVHLAPAAAVPAMAEWTVEILSESWQSAHAPVPAASENDPPEEESPRAVIRKSLAADPYGAVHIAAALMGGNQPQARAALRGVLAESKKGPRTPLAVRRARLITACAATLEAAERAGGQTEEAWGAFPAMLRAVAKARSESDLLNGAMAALGILRRREAPGHKKAAGGDYTRLNTLLTERMVEGITLNEVAHVLGQSPTAITHRLQRKFGMSYSDYLARLRVDKAKELLRRTKLTATEIGKRVGIRDQSNFSKTFRRCEGMSPGEYRRRHGR